MLSFLPAPIRGAIALCLYLLNLIILPTLLFLTALVKWLMPIAYLKAKLAQLMLWLPSCWIANNSAIMDFTTQVSWEIQGLENLSKDNWYLVVANHQSWIDILVLQRIFNRRIPLLKFFMKKELLWTLPFAAWACWLMDFPFMERYSKKKLAKHPELKGKDITTTRQACAKFKTVPTSVICFVEGTRFTTQKHQAQASPYVHLLKPKAGGIAFSLEVLGEAFHTILDVTLVYDALTINAWDFFCGKVPRVVVKIAALPIPPQLCGNYEQDRQFRIYFQNWLNQRWQYKDAEITQIKQRLVHGADHGI